MIAPDENWFANEQLWQVLYPFAFGEERFAAARAEIDQIAALVHLDRGSVLDLACGPGRHAVPFAERGFSVTAVDRSAFLLQKARERAQRVQAAVEWIHEDMRLFVRPSAFDLAVSMFTSFGYFSRDADNRRVIKNVFRSLRPGGRFVIDVLGKEVLDRIFRPEYAQVVPGVGTFTVRAVVIAGGSQVENEWTFDLQNGATDRYLFRHWIYSAPELTRMLCDAGFDRVTCHGSLAGEEYGASATRLVAVAARGGAAR